MLIFLCCMITLMTVCLVHELLWICGEPIQLRGSFLVMFCNLMAYFLCPILISYEGFAIAILMGLYLCTRIYDKLKE